MTDLLPKEAWADLERYIHEEFGLNARVYDDKGFSFTGHTTWCNRLCPAVKAKPSATSAICSVAHQAMAAEARREKRSVVSECDAGLTKICVPVFVDGTLVGMVGGCGSLPEGGEVDPFLLEMAAGIPGHEVEGLLTDLPTMSRDRAEEIGRHLEARVRALLA